MRNMGKRTAAKLPDGKVLTWVELLKKFRIPHDNSKSAHIEWDNAVSKKNKSLPEVKVVDYYDISDESEDIRKPTGNQSTVDIFVVHGRDEEAKESVSHFIHKLKLNPIILHEKPNEGKTILEKLESYANVDFAIVLLTPDDIGNSKDKPNKAEPRARQNVIFELGYFVGKLGREKVCALYKENVEIPTDYQGVTYLSMDNNKNWQIQLFKEFVNAGIVDTDKSIYL